MILYQFSTIHDFFFLTKNLLREFGWKKAILPYVFMLIYSCLHFEHWPEHVEQNNQVMLLFWSTLYTALSYFYNCSYLMGKKHLFLSLTTHNLLLLKRCSGKCSKVSCLGVLALVSGSNRTRARTTVQITLKKKNVLFGSKFTIMIFFILRSPLFLFPLSLGDIVLTAPWLPLRIFWSPVFFPCPTGGENLLAPGSEQLDMKFLEFRTHLCESIDGKQRVKSVFGRVGLSFHEIQVKYQSLWLSSKIREDHLLIMRYNLIKHSPL